MRPEGLPERSCCDDFRMACCCAALCAPTALLSIPFHIVADILCTVASCEESCRVCGATRYEIDFGKELFRRSQKNTYYNRDTYHVLSETCREDGCGFMMAPFANTFFACHGMLNILREKTRGEYNLEPSEKAAKALGRMRANYVSIN